jgi:hypothetical protein
MKVDKSQLLAITKRYGAFIQGLPDSINGPMLLWAIAGNESSFGQNVKPRHEIEFCPQRHDHDNLARPGRYSADPYQSKLYAEFECLACMSYTPWQIMAGHAVGYTPIELLNDLEKGAQATVGFLNRQIEVKHPLTLSEIAHIWNGGAVDSQYIADLTKNYQEAANVLRG